jgi:glucosamine--fructose-6-phosphate aminotransferase (isomerizing)
MPPTTDSFMYQTMHRQPADLRNLLETGWDQAEEGAALIESARRVFITGIGTSYHAALVGAWFIRATGKDARAVSSFDLAFYPESWTIHPGDAVIVMAHTGVKTYSKVALDRAVEAGAAVISVGSTSAEHPGSQCILRTIEREKSAAYTSSHLCAMTVLAQLAAALGSHWNASGVQGWKERLQELPGLVHLLLDRQAEVQPVAAQAIARRVYAAGAGPNEATALELVIKAREAAYGWVDALAAEQFLHGPMIGVNPGDLAVMVNVPGAAFERTSAIAQVLSRIGLDLWLVGAGVDAIPGATLFALPDYPEILSPLLAVVPMQMLAYEMAVLKQINPDTFRRDDEVFKNALSVLTL